MIAQGEEGGAGKAVEPAFFTPWRNLRPAPLVSVGERADRRQSRCSCPILSKPDASNPARPGVPAMTRRD